MGKICLPSSLKVFSKRSTNGLALHPRAAYASRQCRVPSRSNSLPLRLHLWNQRPSPFKFLKNVMWAFIGTSIPWKDWHGMLEFFKLHFFMSSFLAPNHRIGNWPKASSGLIGSIISPWKADSWRYLASFSFPVGLFTSPCRSPNTRRKRLNQ